MPQLICAYGPANVRFAAEIQKSLDRRNRQPAPCPIEGQWRDKSVRYDELRKYNAGFSDGDARSERNRRHRAGPEFFARYPVSILRDWSTDDVPALGTFRFRWSATRLTTDLNRWVGPHPCDLQVCELPASPRQMKSSLLARQAFRRTEGTGLDTQSPRQCDRLRDFHQCRRFAPL
jgi:hypothetical protein